MIKTIVLMCIILIYYVIASCNSKSMSRGCCVFYDIEPGCKLSFSPLVLTVKAFVKIFCRPCGQLIGNNFGTEKWKNGRSISTYIWEDDSPWTLTQPCHRWSWRIIRRAEIAICGLTQKRSQWWKCSRKGGRTIVVAQSRKYFCEIRARTLNS